ncbi:MAG TPA: 4-hydroxythreonine-4-phosphate dehydrogenase PdxA [Gaiellaceae bacterium]
MSLPVVAVTMGDAAGVGPEIVAKALAHDDVWRRCRPLLVGDRGVFERAAAAAGVDLERSGVEVVTPPAAILDGTPVGQGDARAATAAAESLRAAYELVAAGAVGAVVSAPLNKQALHEAGYHYADEVAFLADVTGSAEPVLVGVIGAVATVSVTLHVPLRDVPGLLTRDRVARHAVILAETIRALGRDARLALAALNPHAGEGGLLGREEIDVLEPAVADARAAGIDLTGPVPADTVFPRAFAGEFDGVVCLYHDQANIARKLAGIGGASLFLGLPAVLGTTAHGTAYDIAGTGRADPASLLSAIDACASLAAHARAATPAAS